MERTIDDLPPQMKHAVDIHTADVLSRHAIFITVRWHGRPA